MIELAGGRPRRWWEPEIVAVDETTLSDRKRQFEAIVSRLEMPFFYVPGNNDINSHGSLPV